MKPIDYCQEKVAPRGSSFYYALLYLPETQQQAILPILAFVAEITSIARECHEPSVAQTKLQWWLIEAENLKNDKGNHPVSKALSKVMHDYAIPPEYLSEFIQGIRQNMKFQAYHTMADLIQHCHRLTYLPSIMIAKVLNMPIQPITPYLHDLGIAMSLVDIIANLRQEAQHGIVYLPQANLVEYKVTAEEILQLKSSDSLQKLLTAQANRAREFYQRAESSLQPEQRKALLYFIILTKLSMTLLDEMEKEGFQVFKHRIALTPVRKFWLAWRAYRRTK